MAQRRNQHGKLGSILNWMKKPHTREIAQNSYTRKEERPDINDFSFYLKKLEKEELIKLKTKSQGRETKEAE